MKLANELLSTVDESSIKVLKKDHEKMFLAAQELEKALDVKLFVTGEALKSPSAVFQIETDLVRYGISISGTKEISVFTRLGKFMEKKFKITEVAKAAKFYKEVDKSMRKFEKEMSRFN